MKQACVQDLGERRVSERLSIEGATSVVGRTFWFWFCSRAGRASEARACVRAYLLCCLAARGCLLPQAETMPSPQPCPGAFCRRLSWWFVL